MTDPSEYDKMPRTGTAKMVGTLVLGPALVLFVFWLLVRVSSSPEIPAGDIVNSMCDTTDETTTFTGQLDPDSLLAIDAESATLRIDFQGFLVNAEGSQAISVDDADPESGLIDIEITAEIAGPATCEVASFLEE